MSFEWTVARRYLIARRRQAFISLISAVSILGVAVGVMALIIALALMTGVQTELRDRIVGATAHLQVYDLSATVDTAADIATLRGRPGVTGVAPVTLDVGMMASTHRDFRGISVKGIDPAVEASATDLGTSIQTGSIDALNEISPNGLEGVLIGEDLAKEFGVDVGDTVQILVPMVRSTPYGPQLKPARAMRVVGIFKLGFYEFDSSFVFVKLPVAFGMADKAEPDYFEVRLADPDNAPRFAERLQDELGFSKYRVQDWTELNKSLYSALAIEKMAISLTIGLIVMVAALNIVASLVLLVMEKSPDIAILRTMGASARSIRRIFMYQGLAIGLVGTVTGTVLGLVTSYFADRYKLIQLDPDVYQIPYLPFRVLPVDVATVIVSAVLVCYVATLYPSRKAGALDPAEALRNL